MAGFALTLEALCASNMPFGCWMTAVPCQQGQKNPTLPRIRLRSVECCFARQATIEKGCPVRLILYRKCSPLAKALQNVEGSRADTRPIFCCWLQMRHRSNQACSVVTGELDYQGIPRSNNFPHRTIQFSRHN